MWDGSHLLQEYGPDGLYTYVYTDVDSYEPLAQIHNWTNEEGESQQQTNYFHCDQIGIPREMTDRDGKLLWFGDYYGWGKLKTETNITNAHQPFRLQNQYCDAETGLHYNFFRYYEPDAGRFVNQDPIGLLGGNNLYEFANNINTWNDPFGLEGKSLLQKIDEAMTGAYWEGSATAGFGLAGSVEYAGKGKVSSSIALTAGASLETSVGMSKNVGEKKDGFISEICGTAKMGPSFGACAGSNLEKNAKPYVTGKGGYGAGAGVTANIGYQKTFDLMKSAPRVDGNPHLKGLNLPNGTPDVNRMHPNMLMNMKF